MRSLRYGCLGALVVLVVLASGLPNAVADPATDDHGFVDSTARCVAPNTAVVFGSTANSRVAICTDGSGQYQYRGVRVSDGAKLILAAKPTDGGFAAENDGITYTVTTEALVITAGNQVIRDEPMIDFHGKVPGAATAPSTQPSAAPQPVTPTAPLPPPLPAEFGGG